MKENIRNIFDRLKHFGTELLTNISKPEIPSENPYKKNWEILFKKSSPELQKIIKEKIECAELNDFTQKVIELAEK